MKVRYIKNKWGLGIGDWGLGIVNGGLGAVSSLQTAIPKHW